MSMLLFALAQVADAPLDYGTPLTFEQGVEIGEKYMKDGLLDPYSAHFAWEYNFVPFTEKLPLSKRTTGYATCVTLNAKNAYGGYTGEERYRITIRDGKVIDYLPISNLRWVPDSCKELAEKYGMTKADKPIVHP